MQGSERDGAGTGTAFAGVLVSEVESERVSWLWRSWLALGKIAVMDGDPGLGKSAAALDLAARVSTGSPFPDGAECGGGAGGVVVVSAEDGLADTIKPRLEAAGADTARISSLKTVATGTGESRQERPFALPKDLPLLEREIGRVGAKLVIVDPLMAVFGGGIDAHKDQDVRRALTPLAALADRTGAAVQLVRHLNKGEGKIPVYRGGGSIGIIGAARMGSLVAVDPQDENRRVLAPTKNNLATRPKSLSYALEEAENGAVRVAWLGESDLSATDLLGSSEEGAGPGARGEAEDFLRSLLAGGPVSSGEVFGAAKDARISDSTLRRAKGRLGVTAARESVSGGKRGTGKWVWKLPEATPPGGGQGAHAAGPGRLERLGGADAAESRVGRPVLQDAHPRGARDASVGVDHLGGDRRAACSLTENEIFEALNRRGSPAFRQAELYRSGKLRKDEAVEAIAKTILKNNGADWRASASAVEAALAHPLGCGCEHCL